MIGAIASGLVFLIVCAVGGFIAGVALRGAK